MEATRFGSEVARSWWLFLVYGVLGILFGVLTLLWPNGSVLALVLTLGAISLAEGVISFFSLFRDDVGLPKWMLALYALTSVLFGVMSMLQPAAMADALIWLLSLWLIVAGVARVVFAIRVRKLIQGEWMLIVCGVLASLLGLLFLMRPAFGMASVTAWIAIGALIYGVLQIFVAFRLRDLQKSTR